MTVVPHQVTVVRTIAASREALYAAWTEPDKMRQWFATVVDADVRVGGRYRIELHEEDGSVNGFTGEYLELDPPERIAFTLTHHSQTPEDRISDEKVEVTFREIEPGRTELTVVNSWIGPEFEPSYYDDLRGGWEEWIDRLDKRAATTSGSFVD
jgi:uncharacterized protein YndB with AHSA1/START domain